MRAWLLPLLVSLALTGAPDEAGNGAPTLPPFDEPKASRWINSEPLTAVDLEDRVVLVEIWTFGCVNCTRSIPWIRHLDERFADEGLLIVGVHSPEFDFEKSVKRVREFVEQSGLTHPVLIDNEFRYWRKLDNQYWPAFYLADRDGKIRHTAVGETHVDTPRSREIEAWIARLLAE